MEDIISQLEENAALHEENGKSHEDAVNKAIVEFGDLNEILAELQESTPPPRRPRINGKSVLWFSVFGSLSIILLVLFINLYYTPGTIWFVYPTFGILWWPLCICFFGSWRKK